APAVLHRSDHPAQVLTLAHAVDDLAHRHAVPAFAPLRCSEAACRDRPVVADSARSLTDRQLGAPEP
ncbi:MAG: hypothetical protein ABIR54_08205, partial [Burkholderiaceae bacterium]